MARSYMRGTCSFKEAEAFLIKEIPESGVTCELRDQTYHTIGDVHITVLVYEKYFMRTSNYASLTLVLFGRDGDIGVDIIGAGGKSGVLSVTSWGAEEKFVSSAVKVLSEHGFR